MIFRQITHDDLGCASYLIGDEEAGVAAVVDPRLEVEEYLERAGYMGVTIERILETHNHADHVSGHGRLAAATGARIHIHAAAIPHYEPELASLTPRQLEHHRDAGACRRRHGARNVIHVVAGGVPAWERLGHPLERPDPASESDPDARS